jgi:hypothetical protein
MNKYLDFENEKYQGNYIQIEKTKENIKKLIGKNIVYITEKDIDNKRGYIFPKYNIVQSIKYNQIIFVNYDSVYIKDIIEIGVKKNES